MILFARYWGELQPDSPTYARLPNLLYTAELCKIIKEIRCCQLMLNSLATRWHPGVHFLFINSTIWHNCILVSVVYIYWYLPFILDIQQFFCWIVLVCIYRHAFRYILGFYTPFVHLGDEHVSWSIWLSPMACICHFVFLCPVQSLLWVYLVWVHSKCSLEVF